MATISPQMIRRESGQYDCEILPRLRLERLGIQRISNLDVCVSLIDLSLAGNEISSIMNLDALVNLQRLDLSCNQIRKIENLSHLVNLQWLDLRSNSIAKVDDIDQLCELTELKSLYFRGADGDGANPVCSHPAYVSITMSRLPALEILDGGHVSLVSAIGDLDDRLASIRPDEGIATPPPEPWFTQADLLVDGGDEMDLGAPDSKGVQQYKAAHEAHDRVAELLKEDCSYMLRKAQAAISKSQAP